MGFKYLGDSTLGVSLTVQTPKPLDTRLVVLTREDLYTIPSKYAYNGMPVVCIADGNIYTLLDKNHITELIGWKASYESILIITCTESEYKLWLDNTNEDFTAKDENLTWLHLDTYYYIYEDSISDKGLYYVSQELFSDLTDRVNNKAQISDLNNLSKLLLEELVTIANTYVTKEELSTQLESKVDSTLLTENYYTKVNTDDKFVTKESLRGDNIEGDNFVFVTLSKYDSDKELYEQELTDKLSKKINLDSDASLNSLTTKTIKYNDTEITLSNGKVTINGEVVANNIYNIICISQSEYLSLKENNLLDNNTYYYTYGDNIDDSGYITKANLDYNYYTKSQVDTLLKNLKEEILSSINNN